MYAVLGSRNLTEETLATTMCLIEQTLNARPLVPASSDVADLEALTPNHFLLGRSGVALPHYLADESEFSHRRNYVKAEAFASATWARWIREYVPGLNVRSKWRTSERALQTGDLVWIVEANVARGHYPLARVLSLTYGADGIARSASVKTASGTYTRPVTKLAPVFDEHVLESKNRAGYVANQGNSSRSEKFV